MKTKVIPYGCHQITKSDIDANENKPNLFGGVGVQLAPRLSIASGWNGSTLGIGFGIKLLTKVINSLYWSSL